MDVSLLLDFNMKEKILGYMRPGFRYTPVNFYNQFRYSGYHKHEINRFIFQLVCDGLVVQHGGYLIRGVPND